MWLWWLGEFTFGSVAALGEGLWGWVGEGRTACCGAAGGLVEEFKAGQELADFLFEWLITEVFEVPTQPVGSCAGFLKCLLAFGFGHRS